jgi:hypothetical protein
LLGFVDDAVSGAAPACLGIHAITEFGTSEPDVRAVTDAVAHRTLLAFESRLRDGIERKELAGELDAAAAAQFLLATLSGLKVAARGGAPREALHGIVGVALRALAPSH